MKRRSVWSGQRALATLLVLVACGASPSPAAAQELKKLAGELAGRIHAAQRSRVTVVDFVDLDGKPSKLGSFVAQLLQLELADSGLRLEVVDQGQLAQLFDQVELDEEGLLDPATKQVLGKVSATEVVVVGTVMPSSLSVRLDARAIDLQSQKLIGAGNAKLPRLGPIARLANEAAGGGAASGATEEAAEPEKGGGSEAVRAKVLAPLRTRRDKGIVFTLDGCSLSGDELTCTLEMTSEKSDRWVAISLGSQAWNDQGDEHLSSVVTVANTSSEEGCAKKEILRDVPTPVSLSFPKYVAGTARVERLRLSWAEPDQGNCHWYDWRPVDFEAIVLSDEPAIAGGVRAGGNAKGSGSVAGKRRGFLQRTLQIIEDTATDMLENEARKLKGEDEKEEEDEEPPA